MRASVIPRDLADDMGLTKIINQRNVVENALVSYEEHIESKLQINAEANILTLDPSFIKGSMTKIVITLRMRKISPKWEG